MHIQSFDSLDDMYAAMEKAENAANDSLLRGQVALRDRMEETVYWVQAVPSMDLIVYGETPAAEDTDLRSRGYLTGMAYSAWEPQGEHGDTHVSQVMPVSKILFDRAKSEGFPTISQLSEEQHQTLALALAMCEDALRMQG